MSRTSRRRLRKIRTAKCRNISQNVEVVNLLKWMKASGWKPTCHLRLTEFPLTGRGLMSKEAIIEGDKLICIPASLLITTATVSNSTGGEILLKLSQQQKNIRFSAQQLLSFFLVWEKHLGEVSTWGSYICTLPSNLSTPHVLKENHLEVLPEFLRDVVVSSQRLAYENWLHIISLTKCSSCYHCELPLNEILSWESFLWGWCCVNTRAVYIKPNLVPPHGLLVKDKDCLALAPYLDMFNHSDSAQVNAGLNIVNNCYEIITLKSIKKQQEVFINYGPHSNLKLFCEYGFVIPSNKHDTVPLTFEDLKAAFTSAEICLINENEKKKFITEQGLLLNMFISSSGLSWNAIISLRVLLCKIQNNQTWKSIAFSGEDNIAYCYLDFLKLLDKLYSNILSYLMIYVKKLESYNIPESLGNKIECFRVSKMLLTELVSIVQAARDIHKRST